MQMRFVLWFGLISICFVGCAAHIPRESIFLSEDLGNMINEARRAHLELLSDYMNERRHRVDEFVMDKWLPNFWDTSMNDPRTKAIFDAASTNEEREQLYQEFVADAMPILFETKTQFDQALAEMEGVLRNDIEEHFSNMRAANTGLTELLLSAVAVDSARKELVSGLRAGTSRLIPWHSVDDGMNKIESVLTAAPDPAALQKKIQDIIEAFRTQPTGGEQ
jgi:hypothetical protein